MGRYYAQSGREEDGLVIGKISASIINQYNIENPNEKYELEKLLKNLEENEKSLNEERQRIHNTRSNVQGLIDGIKGKLYPNSWE